MSKFGVEVVKGSVGKIMEVMEEDKFTKEEVEILERIFREALEMAVRLKGKIGKG